MEADKNTLTVNQFRVAARSKKETYGILTIKGGKYLPLVSQINADYISDIYPEIKMKAVIDLAVYELKSKNIHVNKYRKLKT